MSLRKRPDAGGNRHYTGDRAALGRFETFLFAAVSTVVLVRAFLIVTGYPKVGGHGLHVAHVLWGGLLMGAAIAIAMIYPGSRWRHRSAILGGIGFGLFIDEVGKFLTSSVNYFFKPAIAIIYVVFVAFYLIVREVVMRRPLSQPQRLAIASTALADLSLGQLGSGGRAYALEVLGTTKTDGLAGHIRTALLCEPLAASPTESRLTQVREKVVDALRTVLAHPLAHVGVYAVIVMQLIVVLGQLAVLVVQPTLGESTGSNTTLRVAEVVTALSGAYTLFGLVRAVRGNRAGALRVLFRSVLITVLVTQTFVFAEYQALGIVGLLVDLALFGLLRVAGEAVPDAFLDPDIA
jgi:hypothetical protein